MVEAETSLQLTNNAMEVPSNNGESANGTDEAQSSPQAESEIEQNVEPDVAQSVGSARFTGTLKCFSQRLGYGFVLCDETGENLLIPAANITSDTNDLDLTAEWPVEFEIVEGPRGPEASALVMLSSWPEKDGEKVTAPQVVQSEQDQDQQEQPEVFEYDNVQVNETNPESLLVEDPATPVPEKKKTGKELAINCRVKWFNCKKWHGALIREDDSAAVFVRLSEDAIEAAKKRGIVMLEANQRVSVDIDWSQLGELSGNDSMTEPSDQTIGGQSKRTPPFICNDIRLVEGGANSGDLRNDLNAAKLKETNGTVAKTGNGESLTLRQIRRRRDKEQKRKMPQNESDKPLVVNKRPATGAGVNNNNNNRPKPLSGLGGTWRSPSKPANSGFGGQKSGVSSLGMRRGPMPPQMPPQQTQRFGPQPPMPFGGPAGYGRMGGPGGPVGGPSLNFRPPPQRGRSPPPLSSQHLGLGSYYSAGGMMPQYPPQQQPPLLPPQRNPYGSPQRTQPAPLGRSVTLPSLMGNRSMSPVRGGGGGGSGYGGGGGSNALMNLYENAMSAASRLNPYQQRDMAMAVENRANYRGPPAPQQPLPQQQMRYFDPRAASFPSQFGGQPPRRY